MATLIQGTVEVLIFQFIITFSFILPSTQVFAPLFPRSSFSCFFSLHNSGTENPSIRCLSFSKYTSFIPKEQSHPEITHQNKALCFEAMQILAYVPTHTYCSNQLHVNSHIDWDWPRSEHWTTRSRQWHPNGHMCMSGISPMAEPSSSSFIIAIISLLSKPSSAKSQKPLCSKGNADNREGRFATHSSKRMDFCGNIFIQKPVNTAERQIRNTANTAKWMVL